MPDTPPQATPNIPEIRNRLQEAIQLLRQPGSMDPEVRRTLTDLVHDLSQALNATDLPPTEVAHLAASAAHLTEALHQGHDQNVLQRARNSLSELILQAETRAPRTFNLVQRLIEALADIGI